MAALPAQMALGQIPTFSAFDMVLNGINTSPYIIGSMMLMMNLGARFLSLEITKGQEQFLSHPWIRRFLIFVVFFIGTRNVWVAFWMALIVILLIGYLFNENSSLCLFRGGLPGAACKAGPVEGFHAEDGDTTHMAAESHAQQQQPTPNSLTPEEQEILQKLLAKQQKAGAQAIQAPVSAAPPPDLYEVYTRNLDKIKAMF
jgi:hypothetical protein